MSLLPDDGIHPKPVELVLVVVIERATPGFPLVRRVLHRGHAVGSVLQVAPGASRTVIQIGGGISQRVTESFRVRSPLRPVRISPRYVRQTLVHPEQVGLHGFLVVGRRQIGGTPVLSVPRMHVFVRRTVPN